jgi:hypothetical protein
LKHRQRFCSLLQYIGVSKDEAEDYTKDEFVTPFFILAFFAAACGKKYACFKQVHIIKPQVGQPCKIMYNGRAYDDATEIFKRLLRENVS